MQRKTGLLAGLFLLLGLSAYLVTVFKKNDTGSHNTPDKDFAIKNIGEVTKIFLVDRNNQTATLEYKNGGWVYNGQYRARPTAVEMLLSTMAKVNVWYTPPKIAETNMIKSLGAEGIKVEAYDRSGKKIKSYYVGGVTNDEMGTFMIMDGASQPYVVHIPGFTGQLRVRYMLGDDLWRDRTVFWEKPEDIQSISVEYPQQRSESFRLEKVSTGEYTVQPFYATTAPSKRPQRKGVPEGYILQFENVGAESLENQHPQRDSIRALVPFAIITVGKTNGAVKKVRFWPNEVQYSSAEQREMVIRYFTDVNEQDFLLTQHRVFGPVFRGYSFFFGSGAEVVQ
jgi:hypothetical protein